VIPLSLDPRTIYLIARSTLIHVLPSLCIWDSTVEGGSCSLARAWLGSVPNCRTLVLLRVWPRKSGLCSHEPKATSTLTLIRVYGPTLQLMLRCSQGSDVVLAGIGPLNTSHSLGVGRLTWPTSLHEVTATTLRCQPRFLQRATASNQFAALDSFLPELSIDGMLQAARVSDMDRMYICFTTDLSAPNRRHKMEVCMGANRCDYLKQNRTMYGGGNCGARGRCVCCPGPVHCHAWIAPPCSAPKVARRVSDHNALPGVRCKVILVNASCAAHIVHGRQGHMCGSGAA
jgi:hypothetical protein